jgi:hypothetical protein
MCRTGTRHDHVGCVKRDGSAIDVLYGDLWPLAECLTRLRREVRIYFNGGYLPRRSDKFGSNRGVVAGATAKMQNRVVRSDVELI